MWAVLMFEALTIALFSALGVAASLIRAGGLHRSRAVLFSAMVIACVLVTVQTVAAPVRVWFGHAYLVAGYWIPALLIRAGETGAFEAWLVRSDQRCRRYAIPLPTWAVHALELSYLLCYVLVPVAFTVAWAYGTLAETDRFWAAVLLSGFACYGTLPWLISRPPRVRLPPSLLRSFGGPRKPDTTIERGVAKTGLRAANEFVLARVSHGLNTFPSGHVAVSVAAGFEVMSVSRPAGLVMLTVAALIAAGAVAGRYHYAVDVASGIVVGIAASSLV